MRLTVPFFDNHSSHGKPASLAPVPARLRFAADPGIGGMRILHILRAPMGGLFRHVCDLAEEQTRMGHLVGIVCDSLTGGDAAKAELERLKPWCRLGILRLPMGRFLGLGDIATLARIGRHAARLSPDVIHGHGAKGGAYARLLPRPRGRVALYTPHGGTLHFDWRNPCGAMFLALERVLTARSSGILFESQFGARAFSDKIGHTNCPTRVILNGLGASDFAPLPLAELKYDAVFVGELRSLKGVDTLIEAVAQIAPDRPFRLGIAGTGPDEPALRALAAARGIGTLVDFVGHCPAREMFAQARCIVVPSLAESFPYIVLEGVASGRPVIATDVGGIPEIFGPHADGLLKPGDATELAREFRAVLDGPKSATQRSTQLQDRARKMFSSLRMAHEVTRFYGDLIQRQKIHHAPLNEAVKALETTPI